MPKWAIIYAIRKTYTTTVPTQGLEYATAIPVKSYIEIISAIQALVPTLSFEKPIFATFHDGEVHDPLGGGAYAFKDDLVEPVLLALINDEASSKGEICPWADNKDKKKYAKRDSETNNDGGTGLTNPLPTRDIIIHAGVQPNNSPHAGTLVVFCYAFSFARSILNRMEATVAHTDHRLPRVSVEITFVDTAPVNSHGIEIDGIQYQKSYRNVPGALGTFMADYEEVLSILSTWSNIPFTIAFQSDFFSQPIIPSLLQYVIAHHDILGSQLSPKYKKLALRASCPVLGCGLAEKHGRLNVYNGFDSSYEDSTMDSTSSRAMVTFHCPHHGPHFIRISEPAEVARLEANAPVRNLIRSMSYLLDTGRHHVRITGADYAGMYQEVFLYRPLAVWSAVTGLATGRTPHILYAPLIVDWSGAKLSKALYIDEGGYDVMKLLGADGLLSYAQLKSEFGGDGEEGLRRIWEEVQRWVADPRKLFRMFSVEYLHRVIVSGRHWVL
ncbi:hypothetical protein CC78DRAFT_608167 [Lojkania enalia]|uniref:Uncharacterized protein n=1 Tax=Lojkania enalia TaxID=147567 RepID=A0A9P4K4L9_9PLEO|nr:hypothetical protein CC78DRAFT_608167 [Didymosphaeria enalia]